VPTKRRRNRTTDISEERSEQRATAKRRIGESRGEGT